MLERTLEPEVMDSEQDAVEYNRMGNRAVNETFVDEFLAFLKAQNCRLRTGKDPSFDELEDSPEIIASLIDVGTGTALIPIEMCQRDCEIRIMAIDLAVNMLDLAIQNIDQASCRHSIQLSDVDAKDMCFEAGMFDAVISNSIIHHIPDPSLVVQEMIRVTRDDGAIFVRDLMRPDSAAEVDSLVEKWAGTESDYSRRLFRDSLHASLTLEEMRKLVADCDVSPETVSATSDRHWTWAAVL